MTHLTEADGRRLAERHFWVVPVQVALLRAGLDVEPDSREVDLPSPEWRQRREVQARSQAARAHFEGIRRTEEFRRVRVAPGELTPPTATTGAPAAEVLDDRSAREVPGRKRP